MLHDHNHDHSDGHVAAPARRLQPTLAAANVREDSNCHQAAHKLKRLLRGEFDVTGWKRTSSSEQ